MTGLIQMINDSFLFNVFFYCSTPTNSLLERRNVVSSGGKYVTTVVDKIVGKILLAIMEECLEMKISKSSNELKYSKTPNNTIRGSLNCLKRSGL